VGSAAALASGFAEGDVDLIGAQCQTPSSSPNERVNPWLPPGKGNAIEAGAAGVASVVRDLP